MEQLQVLERLLNEEERQAAGNKRSDEVSRDMRRAIDDTRDRIRKAFDENGISVKAQLKRHQNA